MSSTYRAPQEAMHTGHYHEVRAHSESLVASLSGEDACVQSMDDASPAKWHLAHTTWFFETFVLADAMPEYQVFDPDFRVLFNSYYNAVGEQYARPHRGLLTRPGLDAILAYRAHVDAHMARLFAVGLNGEHAAVVELGLHHEQQHQELLLMDVKHLFSCNPLAPAFHQRSPVSAPLRTTHSFMNFTGGIRAIGADPARFSFDNEGPRHDTLVPDFALGSRLITNREYLEFIDDKAYDSPLLWLADGWNSVRANAWRAPLYWRENAGEWFEFTLAGLQPLALDAPVVHVSYYEADAFARWAAARLPTEAEWETVATTVEVRGNFAEQQHLQPMPLAESTKSPDAPRQLFGDVWEWTMSAYMPYPGFFTPAGAIGEYNGKFMSGQMVLRGGSCVTPKSHIRASYRNFFYPGNRWQFGGIRLARDHATPR